MLDVIISVVTAVLAFAVMLPLIVFVHEYGHFKVARLCGVRVDTFSIGFGKSLLQWTDKKGTVWKIAAIPLGGFVKFFGDANAASAGTVAHSDGEEEEGHAGDAKPVTTQFTSERDRLAALLTEEEKSVCFHFKPVWQRMAVVAAGPLANFLLAIAIFAVILGTLGKTVIDPVIGEVQEDTAAAEAGLQAGDRIVAVNGRSVDEFEDISRWVKLSSGTSLTISVLRDGQTLDLLATPRRTKQIDGFGNEIEVGFLGIRTSADAVRRQEYGPLAALIGGIDEVRSVLSSTLKYLGRLVSLKEDPRQLGGPVKIAKYAGQAANSGFDDRFEASLGERVLLSFVSFISLAGLVSVSIGLLNLLPVPVLDGGHLVFYTYELLAGRPLNDKVQGFAFRLGMVMIGSLMIFVLVNDVIQLF
ncbi:MAG: RIP metalloprotease RseP [Pseudomonadota bacterium]